MLGNTCVRAWLRCFYQSVVSEIEDLSREAGLSLRESPVQEQFESLVKASRELKKAVGDAPLGLAPDSGEGGKAVRADDGSEAKVGRPWFRVFPVLRRSSYDADVHVLAIFLGKICGNFHRKSVRTTKKMRVREDDGNASIYLACLRGKTENHYGNKRKKINWEAEKGL